MKNGREAMSSELKFTKMIILVRKFVREDLISEQEYNKIRIRLMEICGVDMQSESDALHV